MSKLFTIGGLIITLLLVLGCTSKNVAITKPDTPMPNLSGQQVDVKILSANEFTCDSKTRAGVAVAVAAKINDAQRFFVSIVTVDYFHIMLEYDPTLRKYGSVWIDYNNDFEAEEYYTSASEVPNYPDACAIFNRIRNSR
jgi:hypothetical protein